MQNIIIVDKLSKKFTLKKPSKSLKTLLRPEYKTINAVNNISFSINSGERVAFIGPNGAGKSTTIKMLAGILHPTSGTALIQDLTPWNNRKKLSYNIGTVFGQRSQLWYHLPVEDSFDLMSKIYEIPSITYKRRISRLTRLFEIRDLLHHPACNLSLGQRMRCEIVASLIHNPKLLFLDEPTIGLDITAKATIRELIKKQAMEENTTLLLTSHDTDDMEKVCDRVIVINSGKIIFDDKVQSLRDSFLQKKYLEITTTDGSRHSREVSSSAEAIKKAFTDITTQYNVADITIENPPMEEIIKEIYAR